MRNAHWAIAFGDYELIIDRRSLTYTLTETKTGTVWATDLSLGWMTIQNRDTEEVTRYDFSAMKQVSVSEKAGPQGKRILFGLDCEGIPVDLYIICSQREIQIQIEATRDTRTHFVDEFVLLPGLCRVPNDGQSYKFVPKDIGASHSTLGFFPVWEAMSMPFVGAVHVTPENRTSALALVTDSCYATAFNDLLPDDTWATRFQYAEDPERRRIDLRILLFPEGDSITIARAYREKVIGEGGHVTLRKKMREQPELEAFLGQPVLLPDSRFNLDEMRWWFSFDPLNRWETMDERLKRLGEAKDKGAFTFVRHPVDYLAIATDFWIVEEAEYLSSEIIVPKLPLMAAVYHDSVIPLADFNVPRPDLSFLRGLLNLAVPLYERQAEESELPPFIQRVISVLCPLHKLTFAAFLTAHRFLTPDFTVEEAIYSDKTRVIINQSETITYETDEFNIPPLGFYVRHSQLEAHDTLRIGKTIFPTRAWRIRQARDGKPLEQSTEIQTQEFPA